tara:strand:- start:155 stop:394 length:240 start_codon:yes stop_codon:yes gene_type:complete
MIYSPAFCAKQGRNPAVTISSIFTGKPNDGCRKLSLIRPGLGYFTLCGTVLTKNLANPTFRNAKLGDYMVNTLSATSGV